MKLKKGDEVIITAGKDLGKRGKIDRITESGTKVLIPGLNLSKRHLKKRNEKEQGGIIEFPKALPTGNIALVCPKCHKQTRVGFVYEDDKKYRICRKCKKRI